MPRPTSEGALPLPVVLQVLPHRCPSVTQGLKGLVLAPSQASSQCRLRPGGGTTGSEASMDEAGLW